MAELICNQTRIPKDQWRYGLRPSAKTGCGWIAVYNLLVLFGEEPRPEELISALERQFPLLHGTFGTLCLGPAMLLKKMKYRVDSTSDPQKYDDLVKKSDGAILFYYWRKGVRFGAHFAALRWDGTRFVGYNTYSNSQGPDSLGESLPAFLTSQGYFGSVLTVVRRG